MPLYEGLGSGGEKTAVVIDLGEAFTKCGFAGESGPRCIIRSEIRKPGNSKPIKVVQYHINTEELYSYLIEFIHMLYFRHLLVNPRDRRVVLIESVLSPSHFRETLTRVLFKYFEVPSVLFAPGHLMSLMTLGINSAIVLDCGYRETLVLPIYEGIPILSCWGALPLGGKAIHKELEAQLLEQCTADTGTAKDQSLPSVMSSIPEEVVEDIKVRICFVSDLERGLKIQAARFNIDGSSERPAPPPDVDYPLDGQKILHVKGDIRDSVVELLFEQDNEEKSVATLILDSLVQCPIDTRKQLSENIVVIGGTAMLPGFLHRLMAEIRYLVEKPKYKEALATKTFKVHNPPAKPNSVAWLGGAIFGALQDILGSRSISKEYYNQTGRIPDWCCLNNPPLEIIFDVGKSAPPMMKRAFSTEK